MKPEPRIEARASQGEMPAMVVAVFRDDQNRRVTQFVGTFNSTCRDNARDARVAGKALAAEYGFNFMDMTPNARNQLREPGTGERQLD